MDHLRTDDLELAFEVHGTPSDRPTIVLLHGFPDDASRLGQRPRGRSALVEGCGHFLHRERPDAIAQLLLEFLAEPDTAQ